jgi:hypothetical protein
MIAGPPQLPTVTPRISPLIRSCLYDSWSLCFDKFGDMKNTVRKEVVFDPMHLRADLSMYIR